MHGYLPYLEPLLSQEKTMLDLLEKWVGINSWSDNPDGLIKMATALEQAFSSLNATIELIPLPARQKIDSRGTSIEIPGGEALSIKKNSHAEFKVLLAGHLDQSILLPAPFKMPRKNSTLKSCAGPALPI